MLVRSKSIWRDRHEADGQHDIVHVGDHGAERELPFEPEPEIDQDAEDREHQADRAVGQKLAGDARAHHFDAAVFDAVAERAAHLLHRRLLRCVAARLLGHADQHIGGAAELLQLHFAKTEAAERRAHLREIGRAGFGLHFHQRAADEVDAEIQAMGEEQRDREDRQQRRNRKADAPEAHEIEIGVVRHDAQRRQQVEHGDDRQHGNQNREPYENQICHERLRILRSARFAAASIAPSTATIRRVSVNAVKTVVMMPMPSVTAKPRTGPVPM